MNFANIDIKKYIAEKGYTQTQIADKLGITREYMSRMLRTELTDIEKEALKKVIDGGSSELEAISEWKTIRNRGHRRCEKCPFFHKS